LVRNLAAAGHVVSVIARSTSDAFDDLPLVKTWTVDVSDANALQSALSSLLEARGPVTGAVLLQRYRGDGDDWAGELATTLTATRNVFEWVAERGCFSSEGGALVVIGSAAGSFVAAEQPVSYHVAKAGLTQMVRYYAVALGSKGVRVNSISPGTILKDENQSFYQDNPELERLYRDIIPLGRMGTAQDVANLVIFLLSDNASFLTGQNIALDGGVSLHWHETLARRLSPMRDLSVVRPSLRDL
jgi:NAD(P)-dependent dehydrogenase (short-subunit alcohol dehydrogenase family)